MTKVNTGNHTCLEIFAKQTADGGRIRVLSANADGSRQSVEKPAGRTYFSWIKIPLEKRTDYEICSEECEVSLCYLSGSEDILEEGVCYLEKNPADNRFYVPDQAAWYDRPSRESYHFSPWKNWMNDPNGLCWFRGYYHMFYQFNPHGQQWSNMYWGHAASRDLVHWVHLPVVLAPQEEILEKPEEWKGGAFSGCAVASEEEVVFYLTRHKGPMQDGEDTVEQQWMMKSRDMVHFSEETCVIGQPPEGASFDFRDPKVLRANDRWYMALGSAIEGKGAILLYESRDGEQWEYVHPLLVEVREKVRCFECPDFMELDGKYVAIGAWMEHRDECGRYQMSRYYTGTWKNREFEIESDGWFDFGSNCYAMQSFVHQGRRISIGWISDFYEEHVADENGAYGSMTIPRELHVKNGKLYMTPVREMDLLKGETLVQSREENLTLPKVERNAYRVEIKFDKNTCFTILLGKDGERELFLVNDKEGLCLVTKGVKSEGIRFRADVEEVRALEIYVDGRTAEVYVNEGEAAGTKVFYNRSADGCFALDAETPAHVAWVEVACMKSIWH